MYETPTLEPVTFEFMEPVFLETRGYVQRLRVLSPLTAGGEEATVAQYTASKVGYTFEMPDGAGLFVPHTNIKFISGNLMRWSEGKLQNYQHTVASDEAASTDAQGTEQQEVVHRIEPFGGAKAATAANPTIPPHPATQGRGRPRGRAGAAKAP